MRSLSTAALSIICIATLQPAHAQTPDLATVLVQHQRAVGGPQIVQQLTTATALWTAQSSDGSQQKIESWFASGGRFRQIVRDEHGWSSSALDGQTAYRINSSTGHVRSPHTPNGAPIDTYLYALTWSQASLIPLLDPDLPGQATLRPAHDSQTGHVEVVVDGPGSLRRVLTVNGDGALVRDTTTARRDGLELTIERVHSDHAAFDGARLAGTVQVTITGSIDLGGIQRALDRRQTLRLQSIDTATRAAPGFFSPGTPATPPRGHLADRGPVRFRLAGQHAVGDDPESIRAADLDGDGDLDLITGDDGSTTWLVNDGTARFSESITLPGGGGSNEFALPVDLDGDGALEVAIASTGLPGSTLFVLANTGSGPSQESSQHPTGDFPESIVAADFDGDGHEDLAVAHNRSGDARVHFGDGQGAFEHTVTLELGGRGENVAAADLNEDGTADLVVVDQERLSVFISRGDRTFEPSVTYTAGGFPFAVATGDLTGDGHADVVVGNGGIFRDTGGDDLAIFRGDGTGALAPAELISAGGSIASVDLADLDLDGDLDVVAASFGTHETWLVENRDGTLVPLGSLPCGWAPVAIVAADLDSDGRPDIAVANEFSDDVSVWLNVATE